MGMEKGEGVGDDDVVAFLGVHTGYFVVVKVTYPETEMVTLLSFVPEYGAQRRGLPHVPY